MPAFLSLFGWPVLYLVFLVEEVVVEIILEVFLEIFQIIRGKEAVYRVCDGCDGRYRSYDGENPQNGLALFVLFLFIYQFA